MDINIWQSDLFSNIQGKYNVIFFNPPYVRTKIGKSLELTQRLNADGDQVWDGGELGTDVIAKFLEEATNHLQPSGSVLIGVQDYYVKRSQMLALAEKYSYSIAGVYSSWMNPSVAYLLKANEKL